MKKNNIRNICNFFEGEGEKGEKKNEEEKLTDRKDKR